jgi:hypothetical protein
MKINVDAAISKNTNRASAAAIVRDGGGQFLGALALWWKDALTHKPYRAWLAVKV